VLIADLGVAKSMLDAVGATMTAGTPSYMAPEQAMGPDTARQSSRHLLAGRGDIRHVDRPSAVSGTQHCRHCRA
jgi:serine/threonine protein kinase